MLALRPALLFCILAASLPARMVGVSAQQGQIEITLEDTVEKPQADEDSPTDASTTLAEGCREVQYPCTRIYSVQRPVKQCLSKVCTNSIRRVYMVNNEICSRVLCKEDEEMEEERCRQKIGLPPRRSARSNFPCKRRHYGA
uniref:Microfibril associated protein 5 n=1 Tax=Ailuropoda melanoleuca TaxID=9646 RepID=A0A7N5P841_AILME